jgi:hypothetical protein
MPVAAAERRWAWGSALAVMALVSLPYLMLWAITPPQGVFWGFVQNPDDHCVYLAWMRQAWQGQLFFENLFTTDPQRGLTINLFFWLLGKLARLTHLPLALVYHLARAGFGALLLVLVYHLAAFFTEDRLTRRTVFGFAALSSGLGWLLWPPPPPANAHAYPVDTWQPEAITCLSLYANALFCAGMAAMVGLFLCLLQAQRTGKRGYVVGAGVLGLLLGNFHSYDVIAIAAVWAAYLLVSGLAARRIPLVELRQALLAGAIALPSVAYQYYLLQIDPVFQARAAVPTRSPALHLYLLGYGLLVPLAVLGARRLLRSNSVPRPGVYLPIVWAVVGLAVAYLPVPFQRKLVEGLHLPIALLAAFGAVALAERLAPGRRAAQGLVLLLALLLTVPTNFRFIARDWTMAVEQNTGSTLLHRVFWPREDMEALARLDDWLPGSSVVQALPWTSCLIPSMSGRRVWCGHWGETPGFRRKFGETHRFFEQKTPSDWRRQFLARTGITHIFAGTTERALASDSLAREPFLRAVHRLGDTILYQVTPDWR